MLTYIQVAERIIVSLVLTYININAKKLLINIKNRLHSENQYVLSYI